MPRLKCVSPPHLPGVARRAPPSPQGERERTVRRVPSPQRGGGQGEGEFVTWADGRGLAQQLIGAAALERAPVSGARLGAAEEIHRFRPRLVEAAAGGRGLERK